MRRWHICFYPRHPRGWRLTSFQPDCSTVTRFLSTPPSRVATTHPYEPTIQDQMFLSTPPSRVATAKIRGDVERVHVSIHATLAGGDTTVLDALTYTVRFYPRHPRGWRLRNNGH